MATFNFLAKMDLAWLPVASGINRRSPLAVSVKTPILEIRSTTDHASKLCRIASHCSFGTIQEFAEANLALHSNATAGAHSENHWAISNDAHFPEANNSRVRLKLQNSNVDWE